MRRFSDKQPLSTLTEINITPLLDLAFVLLVIFMITTPLLENSVDLAIPTSDTAATQVDPSKVQTVSLDRNEVLTLNGDPTDLEGLEQRLRDLRAADPGIAVVVRPDRSLPVQRLVTLMDAAQRAGITRIGVMTRPEDAPAR